MTSDSSAEFRSKQSNGRSAAELDSVRSGIIAKVLSVLRLSVSERETEFCLARRAQFLHLSSFSIVFVSERASERKYECVTHCGGEPFVRSLTSASGLSALLICERDFREHNLRTQKRASSLRYSRIRPQFAAKPNPILFPQAAQTQTQTQTLKRFSKTQLHQNGPNRAGGQYLCSQLRCSFASRIDSARIGYETHTQTHTKR